MVDLNKIKLPELRNQPLLGIIIILLGTTYLTGLTFLN